MNIDYSIIGKRIKESRKLKNYTQENLAEFLNVSDAYISRIERGTTKINLETLAKLCSILDISLSYVLTGVVYSEDDYLKSEISELLKECSSEKIKLIAEIIKPIVKYNEK